MYGSLGFRSVKYMLANERQHKSRNRVSSLTPCGSFFFWRWCISICGHWLPNNLPTVKWLPVSTSQPWIQAPFRIMLISCLSRRGVCVLEGWACRTRCVCISLTEFSTQSEKCAPWELSLVKVIRKQIYQPMSKQVHLSWNRQFHSGRNPKLELDRHN